MSVAMPCDDEMGCWREQGLLTDLLARLDQPRFLLSSLFHTQNQHERLLQLRRSHLGFTICDCLCCTQWGCSNRSAESPAGGDAERLTPRAPFSWAAATRPG